MHEIFVGIYTFDVIFSTFNTVSLKKKKCYNALVNKLSYYVSAFAWNIKFIAE